ncbi:prolyl oligopeptidase family serine peptidase [Balneolaceae bacterium YR4-1]|uniref:Prolyl oligopeptidase family serine peptidase n=1 Tax=Halalkalibaculum roseum TaxID=2709311 RepID=A0A6M1T2D7_9BACT|nr:DPP IV N-terminal domain-containing protein [Halalkalibaculum roseum]NGP76927.1 prolyl oligopeptidase family serine peptidase [Halalkalibaculum roseum]
MCVSRSFLKSLLFTVLAFTLFANFTLAQKADFEQAERFTTQMMEKMVGSTEVDPEWIENQDRFWYTYENSEGKHWYFVDANRETKSKLFDQEVMASKLAEIFNKPFNSKDLPLKDFEYNTGEGFFEFNVDSIQFTYRIDNNSLIKGDSLSEEPSNRWKTYSPDSTWIAFAKNHNLYLMKADDPDSAEYQLTEDGQRWYSFQADEEDTTSNKRLRSNARWFEDSEKLYARRADVRDVEELWVINSLKERPELQTYKYPMPGDENIPQDEVWVFDADSKEGIKLDTDKEEWEDESLGGAYFNDGGFYTGLDSDYLYILRRNRQWNKIDVLQANTETGDVRILFSEESKPYFNTRFAQLAVLNDDSEFVWFSERTGWGQLYLYDQNGNLKNRITDGFYTAGDIVKIDTTERTLYFEAYGKEDGVSPYYAQLYKVNLDGSDMKRLTPENAHHDISASEEGNFFLDNYSRVDMPTVSVLRDGEGRVVQQLEKADISRMEEAGWKAPEAFKVKAADDATDLYGVMWKPFDFDSTKSYPIISYVYPGPQTEPFPVGFTIRGSRARPATLAQLGFMVIAMGQRGGSPLRSKYYHNYGYGDLRDYPLADNKYGIEQLASRHSFIDIDRVGIFGHSGGGFMSTAALLTYPDFYDVAVSSAGNHDNNMYNLWWSEVHNGVKKVTEKVRTDSTGTDSVKSEWQARVEPNTELAGNLQGHLLLVHGTVDDNVHPGNTIRMADALIKEGKRFDLMMLPGQRHGFGEYTPYFERMMWYYFAEHLLGDYRDNVNFNIPDYEE